MFNTKSNAHHIFQLFVLSCTLTLSALPAVYTVIVLFVIRCFETDGSLIK